MDDRDKSLTLGPLVYQLRYEDGIPAEESITNTETAADITAVGLVPQLSFNDRVFGQLKLIHMAATYPDRFLEEVAHQEGVEVGEIDLLVDPLMEWAADNEHEIREAIREWNATLLPREQDKYTVLLLPKTSDMDWGALTLIVAGLGAGVAAVGYFFRKAQ